MNESRETRTATVLSVLMLGSVAVLFAMAATTIAVYVDRHAMHRQHMAEVEAIRSQLVNPSIMDPEPSR